MFIIKMSGLYGDEQYTSYYRSQGDCCFDFVNEIKFASKFETSDDKIIKTVMKNYTWYLYRYEASKLEVVEVKYDSVNDNWYETVAHQKVDDEDFKLNIKVFSTIRFNVCNGNVTGEIVIDPTSILDGIWNGSVLSSRDPRLLELKKLVSSVKLKKEQNNLPTEIVLLYGSVDKNFTKMSMLKGVELLYEYIGYKDESSVAFHNKYAKELLEFVYKCKDIESPSQMCNIH